MVRRQAWRRQVLRERRQLVLLGSQWQVLRQEPKAYQERLSFPIEPIRPE